MNQFKKTMYLDRTVYHAEINNVLKMIRKLPLTKAQTALRKQKIKYGENDFQYDGWNSLTLHVALGWHAIKFAQTSAILEFYFWFRFRPYHRSRRVILHQSAKFYPNRTTLGRKQMTSCQFSRRRISAILKINMRGPIMGSLKSQCTTSYRSSIETIALNCLVFEIIAFFSFWQQKD